jgi:NAD(P)H-nitrite reductase large subunit
VTLADGRRISYDRLLLATGSQPAGWMSPAGTSAGCSTCVTWATVSGCGQS